MIYATFLMRNDFFVPGALVYGYALKKQGIEDRMCFVTDDVSQDARHYLESVFNRVVLIDQRKLKHQNREGRQDRSDLFTRFEVLKYYDDQTPLGTKFCLADGDILPLRQFDQLKAAVAPAAIINEKEAHATQVKNHQYVVTDAMRETGMWHWHEIYQPYLNYEKIPASITDRVKNDPTNLGMNTALWIYHTNLKDYDAIDADLNTPATQEKIQRYNWPEMQYLTVKWSGRWHTLDIRYASFSGYPSIEKVYGIHYAGIKPWAVKHRSFNHYQKFKDFRLWQYVFIKMMEDTPELHAYPKLKRLQRIFEDTFQENPYTIEELSHAPQWV